MCANSAEVALLSADVVLTGSDLRRIAFALRLTRKCRKTLMVNAFIDLGWTIMIVAAAALG